MTEKVKLSDDQISCEICMKEIPATNAKSVEMNDYIVHFCGLECYAKWQHQDEKDE